MREVLHVFSKNRISRLTRPGHINSWHSVTNGYLVIEWNCELGEYSYPQLLLNLIKHLCEISNQGMFFNIRILGEREKNIILSNLICQIWRSIEIQFLRMKNINYYSYSYTFYYSIVIIIFIIIIIRLKGWGCTTLFFFVLKDLIIYFR